MDFGGTGRGSAAPFPDPASSETTGFGLENEFFDGRRMHMDDNAVNEFGLDEGLDEPLRRSGDRSIDKAFDLAAVNPLVSAASPLLWLAGRLNESAPPDDIAEFRRRVIEEIKHFESAAMARDIPSRLVRVSRYAICASIDDIILNTRWGGASGWASSSLVGALYNETWGGERFYDLLSQLLRQPEQNIDALELMAICLAIGFVGKYRVMEGGQSRLTRLRHELYRTIRRVRGPYERSLSGAWQTEAAPYKPPRAMTGPWLAALILLILFLGLWAFSSISLRGGIEQAAERIRALAPTIPIVVERAGVPQIPDPVPPVRQTQIERLSEALATDIAAGRVEVMEAGENVLLRMLGAAFPSGGLELSPQEEPLVQRIAEALEAERGPILVIGHTDNVPVGAGSTLGDNMEISRARAESAAAMLRRYIDTPSRVRSEGRGENDPIASNATAQGRARNRRVDFQIPAEDAP